MLGRGLVRRGDQRLGERKLQDHLAALVGDVEGRRQQVRMTALILQYLQDHASGHLPGVIGIAQLRAFGVGDHVVADPGVEEIAGHGHSFARWRRIREGLPSILAACASTPPERRRMHSDADQAADRADLAPNPKRRRSTERITSAPSSSNRPASLLAFAKRSISGSKARKASSPSSRWKYSRSRKTSLATPQMMVSPSRPHLND